MNKKLGRLHTHKRNAIYSSQQRRGTYSVLTQNGNSGAVLRLCDNILFMSEDCISIDKIALAHDCED